MFIQANTHQLIRGILFCIFFIAVSPVFAMNRTCSASSVDANSPEWLAVRQQYETAYVPPQLDNLTSYTVDANSGIWLTTRQQYETSYEPPHLVDANSLEWLAVRQQYETTYVPLQVATVEDTVHQECLS